MARYQDVDVQMANMNIDDEENEEFSFDGEIVEEINKYELCLVGRFLTDLNVNIRAMKTKMADVWKPAMGLMLRK